MVHAGPHDEVTTQGPVTRVQLPRSPVKFPLDRAHDYDLLFLRHYRKLEPLLRDFRPDVVQITGPSDVGTLGAYVAYKMGIPLAASWQTNLHQYARRRMAAAVSFLPDSDGRETGRRRGATEFSRFGAVLQNSAAAVCAQPGDDPGAGGGYGQALLLDVARRGHGGIPPGTSRPDGWTVPHRLRGTADGGEECAHAGAVGAGAARPGASRFPFCGGGGRRAKRNGCGTICGRRSSPAC